MKKTFILMGLFLKVTILTYTQNLTGQMILEEPNDYLGVTESVALSLEHSGERIPGNPWVVFSDREGNYTVNSPGSLGPKNKLGFLEHFYVLEEDRGFLRIVKDPDLDISSFRLSENAVDYGWIRKENLLLWRMCIMTDDSKIPKKAMTQNTVEVFKGGIDPLLEDNIAQFYLDPEFNKPSGDEIRMYQIYYVYKITHNAVLLGRSDRLSYHDDQSKRQDAIGWIHKHRLVMWDHRIAVEPNWHSNAVSERQINNTKVAVFSDRPSAQRYRTGNLLLSNVLIDEFSVFGSLYNKRADGYWQRYPVYSIEDGIMQIGVMGEITTSRGSIDAITKADVERVVIEKVQERRNINIVFVMDGTNSMQPYFKPAADAVIQSMTELEKNQDRLNVLRFGAVVYRDEAERPFNRLVEIKSLTENYREIAGWLSRVKAEEFGEDKDLAEAVYYGLREALMSVLVEDGETNLVVLIGDAGNHNRDDASQVGEGLIIDMLAEKNVGFLAFQVINDHHPTFDDFQKQVKHLLISAANQIQRRKESAEAAVKARSGVLEWSRFDKNIYRLDNHTNMVTLVYPEKGKTMPTDVLMQQIINLVLEAPEYVKTVTEKVIDVIEGKSLVEVLSELEQSPKSNSQYVSSFNNAIIHFLAQLGLDEGVLNIYSDKKVQFYVQGYTPDTIINQKNPLFKKSLLLSKQELSLLVSKLALLSRETERLRRREALQEAWIEILIKHVGETDRSEILNRTIEELSLTVFGLPSTNSLINQVRLSDLTEAEKVNDMIISSYIRQCELAYMELNRIFNLSSTSYEFSFVSNNITYYWIEQGLLP